MDKDTKQAEKGFNLRIQECKEDIAEAINKSKLPPSVLLMIINEFAMQMQGQNARAIELERKAYKEGSETNGKEIHKD